MTHVKPMKMNIVYSNFCWTQLLIPSPHVILWFIIHDLQIILLLYEPIDCHYYN